VKAFDSLFGCLGVAVFAVLFFSATYAIWHVVVLDHRKRVPAYLQVSKVLYVKEESWGFGPGGNETGLLVYELPADVAAAIGGNRHQYEGVSFRGCPLVDSHLLGLADLPNPRRTKETLNYLREKQGLPQISDVETSDNLSAPDWRTRASTLIQSPLGVHFEELDDYFEISTSGQKSDEEAAADRITRQLHEQIKRKSKELISRSSRLANTSEWQSLSEVSLRFDGLIQADTDFVAENVALVWAEIVSLGSFVEQDDSLRSSPESFASPLDADVRRPLVDLLQTAGPWIRRFPSARSLDEDHAAFHTPRHAVEPARELINAADEGAVIDVDDAQLLQDALRSNQTSGVQSLKARSWGILSVRNLVVGAMGVAAAGISAGAFKEIGGQFAKNSVLAEKSVRLLLTSEEALMRFLEGMPADIRVTVRALIDDMRQQGSGSQFPIPTSPKTQPRSDKRRNRNRE
jgi:hypothetical protein